MGGMFSRPSMPAPPPPPPPPPVVAPAPVVEAAPKAADASAEALANTASEDAMKRRRARSTNRTLASLVTEETKTSILGG